MTAGTVVAEGRKADEEALDALAVWALPGSGIPVFAAALSWRGFGKEAMQGAWEELVTRTHEREALATGTRDWSEVYAEGDLPPGGGCQDAAIQLACGQAAEAMRYLLDGPGKHRLNATAKTPGGEPA